MTSLDSRTQADPPAVSDKGVGHDQKRRDIEGLRAIAMILVLPYHAGLMLLPGGYMGVDVFFVISGFVITRQLLKEVERTGGVALLGFYARRAKRLLPASGLMLVATAVMVWLWVPRIRWEVIGGDIVASSLYVVNWRLAERSVDYLAEDVTPSPVQHFWSLAVEEQYYFVWPLFILLAVVAARRLHVGRTAAIFVGLLVVALPSLAWAVYQSSADPERGYFVTTTRMWELALGAFVALFAARLAGMPRRLALLLGWVGIAMVLVAARIYDTSYAWPGAYALVPTVGTALVIAAGEAAGSNGPVRFLKHRFMQFLGYLSYSLYLWHWPMIVVAREHFGGLTVAQGLAVGVLSIVPAYLSYHLVENPLRNARDLARSWRTALSVGANFTLVGVAAGLALLVAVGSAATTPSPPDAEGAAALSASPTDPTPNGPPEGAVVDSVAGGITPDPLQAPEDVPALYDEGCQVQPTESEPVTCSYGPEDSETTIAVVGDSKAAQWVPALELLAEEHGWRVVTYTMSGCQFTSATTALDGEPYTTCREWGEKVLDELTGDGRVDLVLTAGMRREGIAGEDDGELQLSEEVMVAGLTDVWSQLIAAGSKVVVLADSPQTFGDIYACVAENPDKLSNCTYDREKGRQASGAPVQKRAAASLDAVDLTEGGGDRTVEGDIFYLDLAEWICPSEQCPPVIGNVLVYRQGSHITKTYVETLAPRIGKALLAAGLPQ